MYSPMGAGSSPEDTIMADITGVPRKFWSPNNADLTADDWEIVAPDALGKP